MILGQDMEREEKRALDSILGILRIIRILRVPTLRERYSAKKGEKQHPEK